MSMSKKDFIALADEIKRTLPFDADERTRDRQWDVPYSVLLDLLTRFCRTQNPHFDESRWRAYIAGECGPHGGKKTR